MENIPSPADKESMVSSFLQITVGQSVEIAHQFLEAAHWRIEDAMQLFYVGNEGLVGTSSSYVPPVEYNVLLSDHNHSGLEEDIRNVYAGQGDGGATRPPIPVIREGLYHDAATHGPVRVVLPGMRFSPVEVAPAALFSGATPMTPAYTPSGARRKRRTRSQMDDAAQSSATALMMLVTAPTVTRRRRRTRAEMAAVALSSGGELVCPRIALPTTCLRCQTSATSAPAATTSAAASTSPSPATRVPHNPMLPTVVPPVAASTELSSVMAVPPILRTGEQLIFGPAPQISRRRSKLPRSRQLLPLTTPSIVVRNNCPVQQTMASTSAAIGASSLGSTPLPSGSVLLMAARSNRTRIQIDADAHTPGPSRQPKSSFHPATDPVYKGVGIFNDRAILTPTNEGVDTINASIICATQKTQICGNTTILKVHVSIETRALNMVNKPVFPSFPIAFSNYVDWGTHLSCYDYVCLKYGPYLYGSGLLQSHVGTVARHLLADDTSAPRRDDFQATLNSYLLSNTQRSSRVFASGGFVSSTEKFQIGSYSERVTNLFLMVADKRKCLHWCQPCFNHVC